jgi:hypothetical protein
MITVASPPSSEKRSKDLSLRKKNAIVNSAKIPHFTNSSIPNNDELIVHKQVICKKIP